MNLLHVPKVFLVTYLRPGHIPRSDEDASGDSELTIPHSKDPPDQII
jgi:hypothetical protein